MLVLRLPLKSQGVGNTTQPAVNSTLRIQTIAILKGYCSSSTSPPQTRSPTICITGDPFLESPWRRPFLEAPWRLHKHQFKLLTRFKTKSVNDGMNNTTSIHRALPLRPVLIVFVLGPAGHVLANIKPQLPLPKSGASVTKHVPPLDAPLPPPPCPNLELELLPLHSNSYYSVPSHLPCTPHSPLTPYIHLWSHLMCLGIPATGLLTPRRRGGGHRKVCGRLAAVHSRVSVGQQRCFGEKRGNQGKQ